MPMYVSGGKSFLMNSLTISIACGRVTGSMLWKTMQTVFTSRSGRDAPAVCPGFAWLSASRRCSSRPGTIRKLRTCWRTPSSKISTSPGLRFFTWRPFLSRTTRSSATSVVVTRIVGPGAGEVTSCARPGPAAIATRNTRSGTPTFCVGQFYLFPQGAGGRHKSGTTDGHGFTRLVAHGEVERHLGCGDPDRRSRRGGSYVLRPAGASGNRNEAYKERNTNLLHRTILSLSAGGWRAAQERNHRWTRIHTDKTDFHTIAPMRADRQSFFNRVNLCASVVN